MIEGIKKRTPLNPIIRFFTLNERRGPSHEERGVRG
jgi:hypothetical protein